MGCSFLLLFCPLTTCMFIDACFARNASFEIRCQQAEINRDIVEVVTVYGDCWRFLYCPPDSEVLWQSPISTSFLFLSWRLSVHSAFNLHSPADLLLLNLLWAAIICVSQSASAPQPFTGSERFTVMGHVSVYFVSALNRHRPSSLLSPLLYSQLPGY